MEAGRKVEINHNLNARRRCLIFNWDIFDGKWVATKTWSCPHSLNSQFQVCFSLQSLILDTRLLQSDNFCILHHDFFGGRSLMLLFFLVWWFPLFPDWLVCWCVSNEIHPQLSVKLLLALLLGDGCWCTWMFHWKLTDWKWWRMKTEGDSDNVQRGKDYGEAGFWLSFSVHMSPFLNRDTRVTMSSAYRSSSFQSKGLRVWKLSILAWKTAMNTIASRDTKG